jgi:hypothetical protein
LFVALLAALGLGLLNGPVPGAGGARGGLLWARSAPANDERLAFIAGGLSNESLVVLTSAVAARASSAVLLIDSPDSSAHNKNFLNSYRPQGVIPVGAFPNGIADLESRLGVKTAPVLAWEEGPPAGLWEMLFPRAGRVVVCPAKPRRLLLQAACLAGVVQAPLYLTRGRPEEADSLRRHLRAWHTHKVYAVGPQNRELTLPALRRDLPQIQTVCLDDEKAVAACYLQHQLHRGPISNLLVTNPDDVSRQLSSMSSLAPWVALQRRAALLFTNPEGNNVRYMVNAALQTPRLRRADALILLADLKAIPMEQRPNPISTGKDPVIEMEPLTPKGSEAFSFATGRLFHSDPSVVALMLARERLLAASGPVRKALVVSNPSGGLPLLEAISKSTAHEFLNGGYQTTALFGSEVHKDDLRSLLPEQDIFLWEGHYNTMVKEYGLHEWTEPLRPSLVFLQSCLALSEGKAQPFLQRGAVSVIGSSTRTYSGTGGACALAFFDALLYENLTVGASLRHAKNFLLAYSLLKEKRLGQNAKMTGANIRSAWAFSLWGDPTLKLPPVEKPEDALPSVQHKVHGNTIVVTLPDTSLVQAITSKYKAKMAANGRVAGMLRKIEEEGKQPLVPFVFVEVHLPKASGGRTPQLQSRLPSKRWVFCWDARRCSGYLLLTPRATDKDELRFHINWDNREAGLR